MGELVRHGRQELGNAQSSIFFQEEPRNANNRKKPRIRLEEAANLMSRVRPGGAKIRYIRWRRFGDILRVDPVGGTRGPESMVPVA